MIHFLIKFLLCFSKPKIPLKKDKMKQKSAKVPSSSINKKKITKDSVLNRLKEESPEMKKENTVECSENIKEWCHIEYCLFDEVFPEVEIDVVTWGDAAKIFTKDDSRAVKTVVIGDVVWVYFTMAHKAEFFNNEDVERFKNGSITFRVSQDETKMMASCKSDSPKEFQVCEKTGESGPLRDTWFLELRQTNPLDEMFNTVSKERSDNYKVTRPVEKSIVSMLQVSPCENKIKSLILESTATLSEKRESQEMKIKSNKKSKKENIAVSKGKLDSKKNKRVTQIEEEKLQLLFKAELLIAGDVSVEQYNLSPTLNYVRIVTNASKILTVDQDNIFVPLKVTIKSVQDLPLKFIEELNLKNIYAQFEFGNVLNSEITKKVPLIKEDVTFDYTRVYFFSSPRDALRRPQLMFRPSVLTLAEALLTRNLVVKLYGELDKVEENKATQCLFGQRLSDSYISTPGHEMFLGYKPPPEVTTDILLGSAYFSLIELIKGYYTVETSTILTSNPVSTWDPAYDVDEILEKDDTKNDREILFAKLFTRGHIPEDLLLQYCTSLKIKVSIDCLLTTPTEHQLFQIPQVVQRLLVVFKNKCYANNVVERIKTINGIAVSSSSPFASNLPSLVKNYSSVSSSSTVPANEINSSRSHFIPGIATYFRELRKMISVSQRPITGFFIENEEESILVVESNTYIIPHILEPLHGMFSSDGRIIYDSSLFFTKRLYSRDFMEIGVYRIKLINSMNSLLQKALNYPKIADSEPALQALLLLDLLRKSHTLHLAATHQLFPSSIQLMRFNDQFGEPATNPLPPS